MADREHARAVTEAFLSENLARPGRILADREARRPIADDFDPADIFEELPAVADIVAERLRRQRRDALVEEAVARQLVSAANDALDQLGMPTSDPTQHEEGRADVPLSKNGQCEIGVSLDAR